MGVDGLDHLCVGGDAMVTNKTVTQPLFGTDLGHFCRISHDEGVTYAPIHEYLRGYDENKKDGLVSVGDYPSDSPTHGIPGDSDEGTRDYRTGLDRCVTGVGGNPYDRIITFKDEDGNNLVGDFNIEVVFPNGFQSDHNWSTVNRNIMGVAVFVDFTDDDLHGLTLGVKNVFNNMPFESSGGSHKPHDVSPFKFPTRADNLSQFTQESLENVGNPRANLAPRRPEDSELHSRILFCYPHSLFGELDPCGGSQAKARYGGHLLGDNKSHLNTPFTLTGTCLRRLQILPFMTKRLGESFTDSNKYDYDGGDVYDPYFPNNTTNPSSRNNGTNASSYYVTSNFVVRSQGYVKGTFTQVEVD